MLGMQGRTRARGKWKRTRDRGHRGSAEDTMCDITGSKALHDRSPVSVGVEREGGTCRGGRGTGAESTLFFLLCKAEH